MRSTVAAGRRQSGSLPRCSSTRRPLQWLLLVLLTGYLFDPWMLSQPAVENAREQLFALTCTSARLNTGRVLTEGFEEGCEEVIVHMAALVVVVVVIATVSRWAPRKCM